MFKRVRRAFEKQIQKYEVEIVGLDSERVQGFQGNKLQPLGLCAPPDNRLFIG